MASVSSWISALRPRTLFLAGATAICGSAMAYSTGAFSIAVAILTLLIALILQLLSNMANDLGDFQHGTDITGKRVGPRRTLQSGAITPKEMKRAIFITVGLAALIGLALLYIALQFISVWIILFFLFWGVACIWAALRYTSGKNPYGYKGFGDIFSFFFFGPVAVVGTFFLHTHAITFQPWLPAVALGLLTAAVLNINNMRDLENDKQSGKITIPVRIGFAKAKFYHAFLTFGALFCFIIYNIVCIAHWYQWLYLILFFPLIKIFFSIHKTSDNSTLDPYLKLTSMCTFFLSLAFSVCINI